MRVYLDAMYQSGVGQYAPYIFQFIYYHLYGVARQEQPDAVLASIILQNSLRYPSPRSKTLNAAYTKIQLFI